MTGTNRQFRLRTRPAGPFKDSDFELVQTPIPVPGDGELLVKVTHLSIDPAMRGWMNAGHVTPVDVGAVMRAITIGQVVHSRPPGFAKGDFVDGTFGVQEFALSDGTGVYKVHPEEGRSLAAYLGVLGMTGMTAYFGLLDVGRLAAGDVVLVSGAAGAVGSVAGPLLGADFLAATGGKLSRYGTPDRLAGLAGVAPVPRDSGRVSGNLHRPRRYDRGLQRVFYTSALISIRTCDASRSFYERKRAEGKRHAQAVLALARRRVNVLWALIRDGRCYDLGPSVTALA